MIEGRAFLLQAGDCVESFNELSTIRIREKLKIMLQMSAVLTYGATLPVVKVGRIAGQFVKPRSEATDADGAAQLPRPHGSRRRAQRGGARAGPSTHGRGLQPVGRDAQPAARLHEGRLRRPDAGASLEPGVRHASPEGRRYERLAHDIERALQFMAACGIDLANERRLHEVDVFTSHEGLLLDYEEG